MGFFPYKKGDLQGALGAKVDRKYIRKEQKKKFKKEDLSNNNTNPGEEEKDAIYNLLCLLPSVQVTSNFRLNYFGQQPF